MIERSKFIEVVKAVLPEAGLAAFDLSDDGQAWAIEVKAGGPHLLFTYGPEFGLTGSAPSDVGVGKALALGTDLATLEDARDYLMQQAKAEK